MDAQLSQSPEPDVAFDAAVAAALAAGRLLMDRFGHESGTRRDGLADMSTDVERAADDAIVAILREAAPGHGFLTEERSPVPSGDGARWIVDPLDGTVNFAHGVPYFAVSIALEVGGHLRLGVIFDPVRADLYVAREHGGASLNGHAIHVSATESLAEALLSTGFPADVWSSGTNVAPVARLVRHALGLRSMGAAALDLAGVAAGRFDLHWEAGLRPWDVAAAALLVREAGGIATDYSGRDGGIFSGEIVAGNRAIHAQVTEQLRAVMDTPPEGST